MVDFSYQGNQFLEPKTFLRFYIGHLTDSKDRDWNCHQMVLQNKWKIDASSIGNETQFVNHSHLLNVEFWMRFLDCCSGWLSSLITKLKIEKNTKLITNYLIGVSDISKGFDYCDCNTAFCLGYIRYSNYCGSSYVDFLKWISQLAWVSPAFETTIKVDTNSPQIDHEKKKYFNLSEQTKKEITFFSSVCWKVSSGIGKSSTYYPQFWIWKEIFEKGSF